MRSHLFTSESVTEGHPDKVCDQISDAILDALIRIDPDSRVAVETLTTTGLIVVAGEVTTKGYIDVQKIVRNTVRRIGYDKPEYGFNADDCSVLVSLHEQSPDISQGVTEGHGIDKEQGAGDQGCLKKGTLVRTTKGFLPIEDVRAGNFVSTPQGFKKVLAARMTGRKRVVRVLMSNGMALECTPDHKILCYNRNGSTYWKAASELSEGDFVCILKPQTDFSSDYEESVVRRSKFFTKYNHRVFGPEEMECDDGIGYIQGALIGDGCVVRPNSLEIAFGNNIDHAKRVQSIANRRMLDQWRLIKSKNNWSLKIDSVIVKEHFKNFGMAFVKSPQKTTPQCIFQSPPSVIKSYIRGLFDSDGTIIANTGRNGDNIRIRLGSSSLKLLQETQLLLNDFGIKSSIIFNTRKGTPVGRVGKRGKIYESKHDSYTLNIIGFDSYQRFCKEISFLDMKKQERSAAYLRKMSSKPENSPGIFLVPRTTKNEMVDEKRLGKEYPFSVVAFKKNENMDGDAEVYDLEIEDVSIFSGNGIFVHNSMFGFATNETESMMPLSIDLAHKLTQRMAEVRKNGELKWVRPDGKSQVTVEYVDGKPKRVDTVVIAIQHDPDITHEKLKQDTVEKIIKPVCGSWLDANTKFIVNHSGRFVIGGPPGDTGVTGRKIIVDTYGGHGSHGGGCFSGKDPSKVDRSASYMARHIAKNIVAAGLADRCEIQIAYALGYSRPVSVLVDTKGTGKVPDEKLEEAVGSIFDLRPKAIIEYLNLRRPIYEKTAAYGHFGRDDPDFTWEQVHRADELRKAVGK